MPYFKNSKTHLLLIHVPKTGGTSVETYFSKKFNIPLNQASLYGNIPWVIKQKLKLNAHTYQHLVFRTMKRYNRFFKIQMQPNLRTIGIVRNPYHRIVSDLFYFNLIKNNSTPADTHKAILHYFAHAKIYDNHTLPQHQFLVDESNRISPHIQILRTESLSEDMHRIGFKDFNLSLNQNVTKERNKPYMEYLNAASISIINKQYKRDFEVFGYNMV